MSVRRLCCGFDRCTGSSQEKVDLYGINLLVQIREKRERSTPTNLRVK